MVALRFAEDPVHLEQLNKLRNLFRLNRRYWLGQAPDLTDTSERYGDNEEIPTTQSAALPDGFMGAFAQVQGPKKSNSPLDAIWEKILSVELEADEAADQMRQMVRTFKRMEQQQVVASLSRP